VQGDKVSDIIMEAITTFSELRKALGTDSQGSGTECGWITFEAKKVYVRRHWSYSGGYPIYEDESCLVELGEFVNGEWFPIIIDGVQQKCYHGVYDAYDCKLSLKK